MKRIAVILVRGVIGSSKKIKDTLKMLRLYKKNCCSIISNTESYIGMLNFVKDYITWGEIDKETFKILLKERGKIYGNKRLTDSYIKEKANTTFDNFVDDFMNFKKELRDIPGVKLFFRLKPPVKGFERGGIKEQYSLGGALGYRKEAINELIRRMI
ncbi:MAG: 50S ribosomal protein L30 [Nanoarchaeota archaeon]